MTNAQGFWSYVHKDDTAQKGAIACLARDVVEQFEMITGESIDLFLDQDRLEWGDDWKAKIDASLASVAFFIPVLTPRFFQSVECRRELNHFVRRAQNFGLTQLIMPILYVDFPGRTAEPSDDDAVALIKPIHWEDWTKLRYKTQDSEEYRLAVGKMAERLAVASRQVELANIANPPTIPDAENDDDTPGDFDLMVQAENAMPEWSATIGQIGKEIETIGAIVTGGTEKINAANAKSNTFAARLTVLRQVAGDLQVPTENVRELGESFTKQLNDIDEGVLVIIGSLQNEIESGGEKERREICGFMDSMRNLAEHSDVGLGSLDGLVKSMQPLESSSRDLRAPLRTMRRALTAMTEGREVINSWVAHLNKLEINCDPFVELADESS